MNLFQKYLPFLGVFLAAYFLGILVSDGNSSDSDGAGKTRMRLVSFSDVDLDSNEAKPVEIDSKKSLIPIPQLNLESFKKPDLKPTINLEDRVQKLEQKLSTATSAASATSSSYTQKGNGSSGGSSAIKPAVVASTDPTDCNVYSYQGGYGSTGSSYSSQSYGSTGTVHQSVPAAASQPATYYYPTSAVVPSSPGRNVLRRYSTNYSSTAKCYRMPDGSVVCQ